MWRTLKPGLAWPQNGPELTFGLKFGLVPNFSPAPKLTTSELVGLKLNFPHICKEIIEFFNVEEIIMEISICKLVHNIKFQYLCDAL